jgi:hypothetical protein
MLLQGDLPRMIVQGGLESNKDFRCELQWPLLLNLLIKSLHLST